MMNLMLPPILVIGFLIICIISLKEKALDERERVHMYLAGRISFLVGVGILTLGILIESFNHAIDKWLVIALIVMITTRYIIKFYIGKKM